jgi:hypothetical protein
VVEEQPPDEPGLEVAAHSQVQPLRSDWAYFPDVALLASVPADAVHSQAGAWSPGRSLGEECSPDVALLASMPADAVHFQAEAWLPRALSGRVVFSRGVPVGFEAFGGRGTSLCAAGALPCAVPGRGTLFAG